MTDSESDAEADPAEALTWEAEADLAPVQDRFRPLVREAFSSVRFNELRNTERSAIYFEPDLASVVDELNARLDWPIIASATGRRIALTRLPVELDDLAADDIRGLIEELAEYGEYGAPTQAVIEAAVSRGYDRAEAEAELHRMERAGQVYHPDAGTVQLA